MKSKIIFTLIILSSFGGLSQVLITWDDLARVEFEDKYFEDYDDYFSYPTFSSSVKALAGQEVKITGYFLDLDPNGEIFILSKGPMAACFFCGIGGPETAIEIQFASKPPFEEDDIITVTGQLKLNRDDINHFNYILTDCKAELTN